MIPMLCLYSTTHCHLCELALDMLTGLNIDSVKSIEISDDDQLLQHYGLRIPVIKRLDTKAELDWPFTSSDIRQFLLKD